MRALIFVILIALMAPLTTGCRKGEGPGGKATIQGKIWVKRWDATFNNVLGQDWGGDVDVYIVYGDNDIYDDDMSTHLDGTFRFDYLRPGKYTIFVYSKDPTLQAPLLEYAITHEVTISSKKEVVDLGIITIDDN